MQFDLQAPFGAMGDQPKAIAEMVQAVQNSTKHHVLLGVTGSGKTFSMANVIAKLNMPALVIAPNKTLAAQLFTEFRQLFPNNSVEYFISYYDYYQPEAYVPSSDTYIAKDSSINEDIDKMRHAATMALFERKDVIIVASVSCIYGLGSPADYSAMVVNLAKGEELERGVLLRELVRIQYSRNDKSLERGAFRVRGDIVDILPAHETDTGIRIEFFGDEIEQISIIDTLTGKTIQQVNKISIYPNSHYVTDTKKISVMVKEILTDLGKRLRELKKQNKLVEYQRLEQRTLQDVELLENLGFCPGIENYSRYLTGTAPGEPPPTLLDYFPDQFVTFIDESHITVPQIGAMYNGDRARKSTLVDFGFRLPSALDNRPLNFEEFLKKTNTLIHVSATPGKYENAHATSKSQQIIRPTGIVDPPIEIVPAKNQIDHLYGQIRETVEQKEGRVLVTTVTKKLSEEITAYYLDLGIKVKYLHSDIDSLERVDLIRDLRSGVFDVLIGINLLREGLDLPEVKLVAVLDADQEGFLRSKTSLLQTVGRAARNIESKVIFYADRVTDSMQACMDETQSRREIQTRFNKENNIVPKAITKRALVDIRELYGIKKSEGDQKTEEPKDLASADVKNIAELRKKIKTKTTLMKSLAADLEFEKAAAVRDEIRALKELYIVYGSEP